MATIKSNAIGSGRGSLDLLTYRIVRGRVIACKRITENHSNTPLQVEQRSAFGEVCSLAKLLAPVIEIGFDKTAHGSRRNNFTQSNNAYMQYLKSREIYAVVPPVTTLCDSLKDPLFEGKVMAAKGTCRAKSKFDWDTELGLTGVITLSRAFKAKDMVSVVACISYRSDGDYYETVETFQTVLNQLAVRKLEHPRKFVVNKETMPELELFLSDLEDDASDIQVAVTGIVASENDRSDAYFTLMPDQPYAFETSGQTVIDGNTVMQILAPDAKGFANALHEKALGAVLTLNGFDYTVKGFSEENETPNGLLFDAPAGMAYGMPYEGEPVGEAVPLMKDGVVIASISGLFNPLLAI